MSREQAEEENREIIGPAEDATGDAVGVVPDRSNIEEAEIAGIQFYR